MSIGPVNSIDSPYDQFVYNYTHSRKPLCSVAFGNIAREPGQLNSIDTGTFQTSPQAKDDGRSKCPNITAKIPPPFVKSDWFFTHGARFLRYSGSPRWVRGKGGFS
ncbi:hypothetical protein AVEN_80154-1 [Araneus ventricosus]|uniref:Uncharacterized protein n=1 Tax=Araneus ventricosus TaxID=182803 RepID=A0A4Y2LN69_ARAVE|nr:hypothetical protein AVEN_80154-1 [Araneus ventricosus]